MLDLAPYAGRIHVPDDRPIFEEAVNCAKAGARRAAYVMIWISCAESLKRRFREAQKRDSAAGKVVGDFEKKETEQKSVDRFLLQKAKEYGFINDSAHTILLNIYDMRCLYGHPYEEAPTDEQITHAAAMVVDHVLSQPVRLRHGFGRALLKSLLEEKNYLDDQASAVETFVAEILPKVDPGIQGWLLESYWTELEKMADDASLKTFFLRGVWFSRAVLDHVGPQIFNHDQWHDRVGECPKTLVRVLSRKHYFDGIGGRAQDTLVGSAFDQAKERSSVLHYLDRLVQDGALTERHQERFTEYLAEFAPEKLRTSGISLKTCFTRVITALKSHNWYKQKPVVEFVVARGANGVKELDSSQQEVLGRNILQVADGSENSARKFMDVLGKDARKWPRHFIRGIAIESFVNEEQRVRLKHEQLATVLTILDRLRDTSRTRILQCIVQEIQQGKPKGTYLGRDTFSESVHLIDGYGWGNHLATELRNKRTELVTRSDDDE